MTDPTLVTGGTGTLGRAVVGRLLDLGEAVRVLSRRASPGRTDVEWATGDLVSGEGLDDALRGVRAILHCATDPRGPRRDVRAAERLLAGARAAGGPPLVYISIVGVDRIPLPYYLTKLEVEGRAEASGLPWTILRATQFHNLLATVFGYASRLPVLPVLARTSFQPVDVRDVAVRLADLALAPPAGRVPDFGGPEVRPMVDLARNYLTAAGRRRRVIEVRVPGRIGGGYRAGGHLAPGHSDGRRTFSEFLADRFSRLSEPGATLQE